MVRHEFYKNFVQIIYCHIGSHKKCTLDQIKKWKFFFTKDFLLSPLICLNRILFLIDFIMFNSKSYISIKSQ
jgi:hypothetical protein